MFLLSNYGLLESWLEGEYMNMSKRNVNVVLVHGAWADGSGWSSVIQPLQAAGSRVLAVAIPLTSLSDDIAALERILERTEGPVVLVAHAYAGAVISAIRNERVGALCFIAALIPDEGETVAEVFYRGDSHPLAPKLEPDTHGFIWLPEEAFATAFAQHATRGQSALLSATQRPISVACIQQPAGSPAWRRKPSIRCSYLVAAEDRMISPQTQRFLASRAGADVTSAKVDHMPMVTDPKAVIGIITAAVSAIGEERRA